MNARASRAPPASVVSCQVSRAKPPCEGPVVRKWMPVESDPVEIKECVYREEEYFIDVLFSRSTILAVAHN